MSLICLERGQKGIELETTNFIPAFMKNLNQWGLWKKEIDANGNTRKIPYSAVYGGRASTVNPNAWTTYERATKALHNGSYSGLGLCLMKDIVCIDLDDAIDEQGNLSRLAANIVNAFSDTFIEVSQSGNGLHVFSMASVPKSIKTKYVEIYSSARYIAITGNALYPNELTDKQKEIDQLYHWLNRGKQTSEPQRLPQVCASLSAHDIVSKACASRGGDIFQRLYSGDWKSLNIGDGSQSAADQSFANRLAYWCACDMAMMEEIFQASGLYRNQRKAELAINRAIRDCTCVYRGGGTA